VRKSVVDLCQSVVNVRNFVVNVRQSVVDLRKTTLSLHGDESFLVKNGAGIVVSAVKTFMRGGACMRTLTAVSRFA
jgi:hypothetical protein